MRFTRKMKADGARERLNERLSGFETAQSRVGKRAEVPSDDVAGVSRALLLRSELAARIQETRALSDGLDWVHLAKSGLQVVVSRLERASELAVKGAGLTDENERAAIRAELVGLRDEIVAAANSSNQGRPVFAGFAAGEAVAQVAGIWTYQGDAGRITRRSSETDEIAVNVTADEVFGFTDGQDVFTLLDNLSVALAGDRAAIEPFVAAIDASIGRVANALSVLESAGDRLEVAHQHSHAAQMRVRAHLSEVEEVDIAEAVGELQMQEVVYKATLSAISRALQPSLVDFLR